MQRLQLCTMAQKLHTLTHAEKQNKTADQSGCFTLGLWKRWREQHCEGRGVIIISVFGWGTGSCKVQRRSVWFCCSISRASSVPFPSLCVKRNINNVPLCGEPSQMLCTPGKDKPLQHQAKDHPSSEGLLYHTFAQMCERIRTETESWIHADMQYIIET